MPEAVAAVVEVAAGEGRTEAEEVDEEEDWLRWCLDVGVVALDGPADDELADLPFVEVESGGGGLARDRGLPVGAPLGWLRLGGGWPLAL
jgi:hypothetical protein